MKDLLNTQQIKDSKKITALELARELIAQYSHFFSERSVWLTSKQEQIEILRILEQAESQANF